MKQSLTQIDIFEQSLQKLRELYFQRQNQRAKFSQIKNFNNLMSQKIQPKNIDQEIFQSLNRLESILKQKENYNEVNNKMYISENPEYYLELLKKNYHNVQKNLSQIKKNLNSSNINEFNVHIKNLNILQSNLQNPNSFQDQHVIEQTKIMVQQLKNYLIKTNQIFLEIGTKNKQIQQFNQAQYQFSKDLLFQTQNKNFSQLKQKSSINQTVDFYDSKQKKKLSQMKQMVKKIFKKYQNSQQKLLETKNKFKNKMEKLYYFTEQYNLMIQNFQSKFKIIQQKLQFNKRRTTGCLTQIKESKIINQFGSQDDHQGQNIQQNLFNQKESLINEDFQFYKSPQISVNNSQKQRETKTAMIQQQTPNLYIQNDRFYEIDLNYYKKQSQIKDIEITNYKMILKKQKLLEKSLQKQMKNLHIKIKELKSKKNSTIKKESVYPSIDNQSIKIESNKNELIDNLKYLEQVELQLKQRCSNLSEELQNNQLTIFQNNKENYRLKQTIKNQDDIIKELQASKNSQSQQQSSVKIIQQGIHIDKIKEKLNDTFIKDNILNDLNQLQYKQNNLQSKIKQQNQNLQRQINLQQNSLQNERVKSQGLRQQISLLSQKQINSFPESLQHIQDNDANFQIKELEKINKNQTQKIQLQEEKIQLNIIDIQGLKQKENQLLKKNKQMQLELDNLKLIEQRLVNNQSIQKTDKLQQELDYYKNQINDLRQQLYNKQEEKQINENIPIQKLISDKNIQTSLVLQQKVKSKQKICTQRSLNRLGIIMTKFNLLTKYQQKDTRLKMKVDKLKNIMINQNQNITYYMQSYKDKLNYIQKLEEKESQLKQKIFENENTIKDLQFQLQSQKARQCHEKEQKIAQQSGKELVKKNEIFNIQKIIERIQQANKNKIKKIQQLSNKIEGVKNKLIEVKFSYSKYKSLQEIDQQNFQSRQKLEEMKKKKQQQQNKSDLHKTIQQKEEIINKLNLEHNRSYQTLDSKFTHVRQELQSTLEEKKNLENVLNDLKGNRTQKELRNKLKDYLDKLQLLQIENQKLRSQQEDDLQEINMARTNKKFLQNQLQDIQKKNQTLKNNLEKTDKENQALKQESLKLLKLTDSLEHQLGMKIQSKNIKKVQKKLQNLMEEQQQSREFIQNAKQILQTNKDQKDIYLNILEILKNGNDKKNSLMLTSQIQNSQQPQDIQFQFQNKEISLKLKDLQKIIDELEKEKDQYREIIDQLEYDKKLLENKFSQLSNQIDSKQQELNGLDQKFQNLQQLKDRITQLMIKTLQSIMKKQQDEQSINELYDILSVSKDKKNAIDCMLNAIIN